MKKLLKSLLAGISVFFAFYLAGSFGNASFDITTWKQDSRVCIAMFGLLFSFIGFGACYESKDK